MESSLKKQSSRTAWLLALAATTAMGCSASGVDEGIGENQSAISSGKPATATEFPAVAGLRFKDVTTGVTCSGTLVAAQWVLTAAHCVKNIGSEVPSEWKVFFGSEDLNKGAAKATSYGVVEVHANADWNPDDLLLGFGDVALLKLDRPAEGITPMPLHRSVVPAGTSLTMVGFGRAVGKPTTEAELSGILRQGDNVTVACASLDGTPAISDERALCFDSSVRAGSCERDSGGPSLVKVAAGYEVAGVVSGGRDPSGGACARYVIHAAVARELPFLDPLLGTQGVTPGDGTGPGPSGGGSSGAGSYSSNSSAGCSTVPHASGSFAWLLGALATYLVCRSARRRSV